MFNKRCCCNKGFMPQPVEPIYEPMVNNCVEKDFYCEVPQDCQFMLYTKYGMNLHT